MTNGRDNKKTSSSTNKQPVRWNVIMFDPVEDSGIDHIVARNLSDDEAFKTMYRLERRNPRMGYGGRAVKF